MRKEAARNAISDNEEDNVLCINLGKVTEHYYMCSGSGGNKYGKDAEALYNKYCRNGGYTLIGYSEPTRPTAPDYAHMSPSDIPRATQEYNNQMTEYEQAYNNRFSSATLIPVVYDKFVYRDSKAGIYEDFCRNSGRSVHDEGNIYLYEYLNRFCDYVPLVSRSYDTFKAFTSTASENSSISSIVAEGEGYNGEEYSMSAEVFDRAKFIWDGMISWGYSEVQTAGAMGNFYFESANTFDYSIGQFGENDPNWKGHGIAQFTGLGEYGSFTQLQNFAASRGKDWYDPETQVQFVCITMCPDDGYVKAGYTTGSWWFSVTDYPLTNRVHMSGEEAKEIWNDENSTPSDIAEAVTFCYEKPREDFKEEHLQIRKNYAEFFYDLFAGSEMKYGVEFIEPSTTMEEVERNNIGGASKQTKGLNKADKESFANFYLAGLPRKIVG